MIRIVSALALLVMAALPLRAMDIVEVTSPGGITAWLVQEPSIPILSIDVSFRGGAALDPADKAGATYLMTGLLEEGSRDLDSTGFAAAAETLAARFSWDGTVDSVEVSATMLTENRDATIDLLAGALSAPRFDPDAVARVQDQVLSTLRSDATDPNEIARDRFYGIVYAGHPYALPVAGTIGTVSVLDRDDIVAAHRRALVRSRATVGVVGDITPAELGPLLDRLLGALPQDGPPLPPPAEVHDDVAEIVVVPYDTPQSVALFGHSGIARDDPDFIAAFVLNTILGGSGFSSRLGEEVREKRGLTYGIYTYLASRDLGALTIGNVASANDRIGEVIDLVRREWAAMAEEGVTASELDDVKRYLTGAYALRFTSNGAIASNLVGMQAVGLPIDYVDIRNDLVNALTLEEVNRVAADLLKPQALRFVVVGQPVGVEPTR